MNTELASVMNETGRVVEWASNIKYQNNLTSEEKDISQVMDAWAKELGRTGYDPNHEISQMIIRAFTPEVVTTPSELIDRMFDSGSIGEFDDYVTQKAPTNTIQAYESVLGGNVDRSFIDFSYLKPTWKSLQAETDLSLQDVRLGGYKTVANLITYIKEALEAQKIKCILDLVDGAITSGNDNYIAESTAMPTVTSMDALALYLADVSDGETPLAFGLNKYIQAVSGLDKTVSYATDKRKDQWSSTGFISQYGGVELFGLSGQKKLASGDFIVPDKRLFGIAGKIGDCITRGDTQVLQETDINSEKIHIKVNGYTFGTLIKDATKVAKIVMAQ